MNEESCSRESEKGPGRDHLENASERKREETGGELVGYQGH